MPTEPDPVTLAQLVHRAAEITDPEGADEDVVALEQRFEDADWPVSGILESIEQRMAEAAGVLDPQEESPGLQMAAAVAVYLAHRRDELSEQPDHVLRMAARAEYDGRPPEHVAQWLQTAGIEY
jgi:hypothetical protein